MKKVIGLFVTIVLSLNSIFALEFSVRMAPSILLPVKSSGGSSSGKMDLSSDHKASFGGNLQADVNLFNIMSVGVEGLFYSLPSNTASVENMSIFGGGLGLGAYYYPLSRLYVGAGGSFGVYQWRIPVPESTESSKTSTEPKNSLYWRAYGEVGFRVNPSLTVSASGGYVDFMEASSSHVHKGPYAGVSVKITGDIGAKGSGNVSASIEQYDNIYPVFMQLYRTAPIGTIKLTNFESAEIRDVKVSFRAGKYTSSAMECAKINRLNKFKSEEIPLMVDFSDDILNFSEDGVISGEVVIEYDFLGKKKTSIENVVLTVNNRNAFLWSDAAALGAFVSPDTPEVLELAKFCAGVARNNLYTGMNRNIQFAAAIVEGLRAAGITYSGDTTTPYLTYHTGYELDSIQYPLQTMNCLSGDYDDLGILLAACLESIGVPTALIPADDDFLVLVSLDVKPTQAGNHFASTDKLLIDDTDAYFALSMANYEKGFTNSLLAGGEKLKKIKEDTEGDNEYINIHTAWELYPPVVYSRGTSSFEKPSQAVLEEAVGKAVKAYIDAELLPIIDGARAAGNDNKLGVALVRAGKYTEAKEAFNRAAKTGSLAAMNNVGNVLMYEKNYSGAAAQYKKVLEKDQNNKTALKGLENAMSKLEG